MVPYHRLWMSKFRTIDVNYELTELEPVSKERFALVANIFDSVKLECEIIEQVSRIQKSHHKNEEES